MQKTFVAMAQCDKKFGSLWSLNFKMLKTLKYFKLKHIMDVSISFNYLNYLSFNDVKQ